MRCNVIRRKMSYFVVRVMHVYVDGTVVFEFVDGTGYYEMDRAKQEANRMEWMNEPENGASK